MEQLGQLEQPDLTSPGSGRARTGAPEQLVVIQPTPFCNIDCDYCYLPDRNVTRRMSAETLSAIAHEVCTSALLRSHLTFVWHAGEPLAAGRDFFQAAFDEVARHAAPRSKQITHSIQTNGTLLDARWIELLQRHGVRLGLSIDGPAFLHDRHRRRRDGRGTHAAVMRAVEALHRANYPFSVIAVVTRESLAHPDEFFDFFASLGATVVGLNVEEAESAHPHSALQENDSETALRRFYAHLLRRQEASGRRVLFREFRPFLALLDGAPMQAGTDAPSSAVTPFSIVNFDVDGRFSTYCPELLGARAPRFNSFVMGRVPGDRLDGLLGNALFANVRAEIDAGVARCRAECDYWRFCGGGNPSNKFFEHGRFDVTATRYCRQHKQLILEVALEHAEHGLGLHA